MGACSTKGVKGKEDRNGKPQARSPPATRQSVPTPADAAPAPSRPAQKIQALDPKPKQEVMVDQNQIPVLPRRMERDCIAVDKIGLNKRDFALRLIQAVAVEQSLEATYIALKQHPDPNVFDADGDTPLCHAIVAPSFHTPRGLTLLKYLATPQVLQESPQALTLCGVMGRVKAAELLLSLDAQVTGDELCATMASKSEEDDEETFESEQGQLVLRQLLKASHESLNEADDEGFTPLHLACKNGKPVSGALFVEEGSSLVLEDADSCLPIHHAMALDETKAAVCALFSNKSTKINHFSDPIGRKFGHRGNNSKKGRRRGHSTAPCSTLRKVTFCKGMHTCVA